MTKKEKERVSETATDEIKNKKANKETTKAIKKQAKEKITKLKHGELTEDEVYEWLQENK